MPRPRPSEQRILDRGSHLPPPDPWRSTASIASFPTLGAGARTRAHTGDIVIPEKSTSAPHALSRGTPWTKHISIGLE